MKTTQHDNNEVQDKATRRHNMMMHNENDNCGYEATNDVTRWIGRWENNENQDENGEDEDKDERAGVCAGGSPPGFYESESTGSTMFFDTASTQKPKNFLHRGATTSPPNPPNPQLGCGLVWVTHNGPTPTPSKPIPGYPVGFQTHAVH